MDFYTLSDKYIEKELGHRIKALRLGKNITQKELAEATTLSLNSIKSLESGRRSSPGSHARGSNLQCDERILRHSGAGKTA